MSDNKNQVMKKEEQEKSQRSVSFSGTFKGDCKELENSVFDCSDWKSADQYSQTKKKIDSFVGRTYDGGAIVQQSLKLMQEVQVEFPEDIDEEQASKVEIRKYEKRFELALEREDELKQNLKKAYFLASYLHWQSLSHQE